jgi:hypothetical protein
MKLGLFASMLALALAVGIPSASFAGPNLGDSDGDGIDDLFDNCTDIPNAVQIDVDGDGCGNPCDADYTQDGLIGGPDFLIFRADFGTSAPGLVTDHNGDDIVGGPDFLTFRAGFGGTPGPSLRPTRDLVACP